MVTRPPRFWLRLVRGGAWWRLLSLAVLLALSAAMFLYTELPTDDVQNVSNNLLVFLLVNLNIVILCVLVFLVGRNVVKLIFDRRRNILGSKLRMRLVVAFVGLALIPSTVLFILASSFITNALEGWFRGHVEGAVSGAVEVAKIYLRGVIEDSRAGTAAVAADLAKLASTDERTLHEFFEKRRERHGFFSIGLYDRSGAIARNESAASLIENFKEPDPNQDAIAQALSGAPTTLTERREASQFVRSYVPLTYARARAALVTAMRLDPELAASIQTVNDSFREYSELKRRKNPLKTGYVLILTMITGMILFAAIWVGFYIARDISVPIQRIAEGTTQVARGNYDFQIRAGGSDELGFLARSFNQMTRDLKSSRDTGERRRLFIETVLERLAVGVVALDGDRLITLLNTPAQRLLAIPEGVSVIGRPIEDVVGADFIEQLRPLIDAESTGADELREADTVEREVTLRAEGSERQVICTVGTLQTAQGTRTGSVLILDDITELSKAQQMSAWREVARRIAHEIKNPLTPIQLSAQRLEKLVPPGESSDSVKECVETIVQNVDSIKRLANEFSHFARMPTAQFEPSSLNALVADTAASFAASHVSIVFQFLPDDKVPLVMMDREQIRRVLINLVDNAIAAFPDASYPKDENPRIVIKTNYDRKRKTAVLEVSDNGPGIPDLIKGRIFDPYFTTKKGGTGLGLAIVTSIVNDHQGHIRVYDNQPRGTKFIVELAITPNAMMTQRRFAQKA